MAWPQTSTTTANLNLRSSPSMSGSILTVMPNSSSIQLTGEAQNGWYPVSYNGQTGWASAQYLTTPQAPAPSPTPPPETSPAPPPAIPHTQSGSSPFYNPASTYGSSQNWYDTPLVKQSQDFDAEWEKTISDQGYGGINTKGNVARNLIDRAKSGFNAATMNNPNLDTRTYINQSLGPNFLRNAMAAMTPIQRGEMPGVYSPVARWNPR